MESIKLPDVSNAPNRICVFPVKNHDELLLRIPYILLNNINLIRKDLVFIPIHYRNNILDNTHLGFPLYHVDVKDSEFAKRGYITPKDVVFLNSAKSGITILKKAHGVPVLSDYKPYFESLIGLSSNKIDFHEFGQILEIKVAYGVKAVVKVLDCLKQKKYTIKSGQLGLESKSYKFVPTLDFYVSYKLCVEKYLNTLKNLSCLPLNVYKNAIDNIILDKEFIFDFYNPSNVFIDWEKEEFNFIDFIFEEKRVKSKNIKEQVLYFRNALFGVYSANLVNPEDLLFYEKDIEMFEQYAKIITDKINSCVPDEYKISDIRTH